MVNVLAAIVAHKREMLMNVADINALTLEKSTRSFRDALSKNSFGFIMECKKASPSKGLIRDDFDIEEIITAYEPYADAISVLTEERFFRGGLDVLEKARELTDKPLLCKDFVVEPKQVRQARFYGADAILLMLSVLDDRSYQICAEAAQALDMDILTEVHDEDELERAIKLGAKIIGINNRDLRSLRTDLAHTARLAPKVPKDCIIVTESGIGSHDDLLRVAPYADACLVGSSLMSQDKLQLAAAQLVHGDIKICGVTQAEDIDTLADSAVSRIGLIFAEKSPRKIAIEPSDFQKYCFAKTSINSNAKASFEQDLVGVFQNQSLADIEQAVNLFGLKYVQLHGIESFDFIENLKSKLPDIGVIKVFHVDAENCQELDVDLLESYIQSAFIDEIIMDSQVGNQQGGTGKRFAGSLLTTIDWKRCNGASFKAKVRLAGGLNEASIRELKTLGFSRFDIGSASEIQAGIKSAEKIANILQACQLQSRDNTLATTV